MFSLDPAEAQFSQAVFGVVAFIILNVLVTLFLFNKYLEEKRKNRLLSKSSQDNDAPVAEFLKDQFNQTKSHNRTAENIDNQLHKHVVQLRCAYLKIEEKALPKKVGSPHYWSYLDENLTKLIKILFPQATIREREMAELEAKVSLLKERITRIPNTSGNEKVEHNKARAIASLEHIRTQPRSASYNRQKLQQQLEKVEAVVGTFEDSGARKTHLIQEKQRAYLTKSEAHADELSRINEKSAASIDLFQHKSADGGDVAEELGQFKSENQALTEQIAQLKRELRAFKGRLSDQESRQLEHGDCDKTGSYELSDISEELIESNEMEIDRLRGIIANQRSSIFEMEATLGSLEKLNQHDSNNNQADIDQLKRCITESEICISMLEQELDNLKKDLDELREQRPHGDLSVAESQQLSEEVKQLKSEIEASYQQINAFEYLSSYTSEALSAHSVDDVALLAYEAIGSLNYAPLLLIKSPERTLELSAKGSVSVREKVIVNNMQINEVTPGTNGQIDFRFMQISGTLRPSEEFEIHANDQALALKILKLTDKIIALLTIAQKAKHHARDRDETLNSIKRIAYDLDKLIEEHGNKSKTVIARNFKQIADFMRAKGMSATQVAAIHNIEQETLKQVDSANNLRLKSRKGFLGLIQRIEKPL